MTSRGYQQDNKRDGHSYDKKRALFHSIIKINLIGSHIGDESNCLSYLSRVFDRLVELRSDSREQKPANFKK